MGGGGKAMARCTCAGLCVFVWKCMWQSSQRRSVAVSGAAACREAPTLPPQHSVPYPLPVPAPLQGMGEPLNNYEAVKGAVRLMTDPRAFGLRRRKVTVSTVGVIPRMLTMAEDMPGIRCGGACRALAVLPWLAASAGYAAESFVWVVAGLAGCACSCHPAMLAGETQAACRADAAGGARAHCAAWRCLCMRPPRSCGRSSCPAPRPSSWTGAEPGRCAVCREGVGGGGAQQRARNLFTAA